MVTLNDREYDVCLSFAGEDRPYVEQVAAALRAKKVRVFYDAYEKARLWGKDLYQHLGEVYGTRARFCVIFISEAYARKLWTRHELKSAQARAFAENSAYLLPVRLDQTELPGVIATTGYVSGVTPEELSKLIAAKLTEALPSTATVRVAENAFRNLIRIAQDMDYGKIQPDRHQAFGFDGQVALAEAFGDHAPLLREWRDVCWTPRSGNVTDAALREAFEEARRRAIGILEAALRGISAKDVESKSSSAPAVAPRTARHLVFVSYSHSDARWLQRLQVHLRPFERDDEIRRWDDTMLKGGEDWRESIRAAIAETKVAILLISADFIASDFVHMNELPPLLAAAKSEGAVILPIIISASSFETNKALSRFQAVNRPSKPLDTLRRAQQEQVFALVAARVAESLANR